MGDRAEMLEAALDLLDEGVAVLDEGSNVVFWNRAAVALTGYRGVSMLSRPCPEELYQVDTEHRQRAEAARHAESEAAGFGGAVAGYSAGRNTAAPELGEGFLERPTLVTLRHHQGHRLPAMLRRMPLRNGDGTRVGAALLFHAVEEADGLPHGDSGDGVGVARGQADMEYRLDQAQHQWATNRVPFGVLWVTVDQAAGLRKTHGRDGCESMLRIMEQTLVRGLRPTEIVGRWGDDEFLVVSHERTAELLLEHAHRLAGLARTAEFRWWGDRVSLTVSVGAAQMEDEATPHAAVSALTLGALTLGALLDRARQAMQTSVYAGGNQVTAARGRECSQS